MITLSFVAVLIVTMVSCVKDLDDKGIYSVSEYTGTVINGNTTQPVEGVLVQLIDGQNVYTSSYTNSRGEFFLSGINPDELDEYCYIMVDGSGAGLSTKRIKLSGGGGNSTYDYKLITLY